MYDCTDEASSLRIDSLAPTTITTRFQNLVPSFSHPQLLTCSLACDRKISKSGAWKKLVGCTRLRLAIARGFLGAGGQKPTSTSGILCSFALGVSQPPPDSRAKPPSSLSPAPAPPVKEMSKLIVDAADMPSCLGQQLAAEDCCDIAWWWLTVRTGRSSGKHTQLSSDSRLLPDPPVSIGSCVNVCRIGQHPAVVGAMARMLTPKSPLPQPPQKKKPTQKSPRPRTTSRTLLHCTTNTSRLLHQRLTTSLSLPLPQISS